MSGPRQAAHCHLDALLDLALGRDAESPLLALVRRGGPALSWYRRSGTRGGWRSPSTSSYVWPGLELRVAVGNDVPVVQRRSHLSRTTDDAPARRSRGSVLRAYPA